MSNNRLAFFGGSFNPIHNMHVRVIKSILDLKLASQILVSCIYQNPLKILSEDRLNHENKTMAKHRLAMLELALDKISGVSIEYDEIESQKVSYTIDTLRSICKKRGVKKIAMVVGSDIVFNLFRWKDIEKLNQYASLIVYPRKNINNEIQTIPYDDTKKILSVPHTNCKFEAIMLSDVHTADIQSSILRDIADETILSRSVPAEVLKYIKKNNLYGYNK